jgi:hypothetical protein
MDLLHRATLPFQTNAGDTLVVYNDMRLKNRIHAIGFDSADKITLQEKKQALFK